MESNQKFSAFECDIISNINRGFNTIEKLTEETSLSESVLVSTLADMEARGFIVVKKGVYTYSEPLADKIIVLEGNLLLPLAIIRWAPEGDKPGYTLINRGEMYKFPYDFDVRRIVWNVKLDNKTNSV